jgi:hypothetical protein
VFWPIFRRRNALRTAKSSRATNDRTADAALSGLTMRQGGGAFCVDPEQAYSVARHLHHFKTTARNAPPW